MAAQKLSIIQRIDLFLDEAMKSFAGITIECVKFLKDICKFAFHTCKGSIFMVKRDYPSGRGLCRMLTLDECHDTYSQSVDSFEKNINKPGQLQRSVIGFGLYCDHLRKKGFRIL